MFEVKESGGVINCVSLRGKGDCRDAMSEWVSLRFPETDVMWRRHIQCQSDYDPAAKITSLVTTARFIVSQGASGLAQKDYEESLVFPSLSDLST